MPEMSDKFIENWLVIINKQKYRLTQAQAEILKNEIAKGSRGIVMFKDFSISIPYIEEFYLEGKTLNPKYQLEKPVEEYPEPTEEQRLRMRAKIKEARTKLLKKINK